MHRHHGDDPVPPAVAAQMPDQKGNGLGRHPGAARKAVKGQRQGRGVTIHHRETGDGILPGQAPFLDRLEAAAGARGHVIEES